MFVVLLCVVGVASFDVAVLHVVDQIVAEDRVLNLDQLVVETTMAVAASADFVAGVDFG